MLLNDVCEVIVGNFSNSGDFGELSSELLRNPNFVLWEFFRTLHQNLRDFEKMYQKKGGNECVCCELPKHDIGVVHRKADGFIQHRNIPNLGDKGSVAIDVKTEGISDHDLAWSGYNLARLLSEHESEAAFVLWLSTSSYSSGEKLDTIITELASKYEESSPKHDYAWRLLRRVHLELQFHLCPGGSKLSVTLWRVRLND